MALLGILCSICAVVLVVSTYAWFIGMKTVNVSTFDIDIATTEGLFLSMNGVDWSYKLDAKNATSYTGNTNSWADGPKEGLIPMSTVGDMDPVSSRMKLSSASLKYHGSHLDVFSLKIPLYSNKFYLYFSYIKFVTSTKPCIFALSLRN